MSYNKELIINGEKFTLAVNISGKGAPTSITAAKPGMWYLDELSGKMYYCISDVDGRYIWQYIYGTAITEQVDKWLDEHPEATTTVQDASLTSEKFTDDLKLLTIKDYVTPEMFGAVGDGVADDTIAVQMAVKANNSICLSRKYLINQPIILSDFAHVFGGGTITKQGESSDINACFVLTGKYITINNIMIYGDINNGAGGIAISTDSRIITIKDVNIRKALYGIRNFAITFMINVERAHIRACEAGFDFYTDNSTKTTISLNGCYVENCGSPYAFNNVMYSTITNCAADMCNWNSGDNPHGDGGHGDKTTSRGVYTFRNCHAINMIDCGTEKSFGNGAVMVNASNIGINGLYVVDLQSEYTPDYTNLPNYGVGVINTAQEKSTLQAKSIIVTGFSNPNATKTPSVIAWNYNKGVYGEITERMCIVETVTKGGLPLFGGMGYNNILCVYLNDANTELGYSKKYYAREIKGTGNKLKIPVESWVNNNRNNVIHITACNTSWDATSFKGFECTVGVCSSTAIGEVTMLSTSDENITVSKSGLNVILTLPDTYTYLTISGEVIGKYNDLVKWDDISLTN